MGCNPCVLPSNTASVEQWIILGDRGRPKYLLSAGFHWSLKTHRGTKRGKLVGGRGEGGKNKNLVQHAETVLAEQTDIYGVR